MIIAGAINKALNRYIDLTRDLYLDSLSSVYFNENSNSITKIIEHIKSITNWYLGINENKLIIPQLKKTIRIMKSKRYFLKVLIINNYY
jgi:hypothetical protein